MQNAYAALVPVGPLAWNAALGDAAAGHNAAMIAADEQSHRVAGEADLLQRVRDEGYNPTLVGENIYAFASGVMYGHAGFMVDWGYDEEDLTDGRVNSDFKVTGDGMQDPPGHRDNIMNPSFKEIGIAIDEVNSDQKDVGPLVITQDLGKSGSLFLTGVAYDDSDGDLFYSVGEGRGDLVVSVRTASVTSFASGGYSLGVTSGSHLATLTGGGLSAPVAVDFSIGTDNLKLDVVNGNTLLTSGSLTVSGPVTTIRALGLKGLLLAGDGTGQTFVGNPGNDRLEGRGGDDILEGRAGNDTLDGGTGTDIAIFSGSSTQYSTSGSANSLTLVGPDGTDTALSVELFRFDDGDFAFDSSSNALVQAALPDEAGDEMANQDPIIETPKVYQTINTQAITIKIIATDPDGDPLTFRASGAAGGTLTGGENGVFIYTPSPDFTAVDSFLLTVSDGNGGVVEQRVNVIVWDPQDPRADIVSDDPTGGGGGGDPVNQDPQVDAAQTVQTSEDKSVAVNVSASDPDGDTLTYGIEDGPDHGSVTGTGGGGFTYTPDANYFGSDSFVVKVDDGNGGTALQTITVDISSVNDAPVILSSSIYQTTAGLPIEFVIAATDPDGDEMSYSIGGVQNGTLTDDTQGGFFYRPDIGFIGTETLSVEVADGQAVTTQNIRIDVLQPAPGGENPSSPGMSLITSNGFAGQIGGNGSVIGTQGFQKITVADDGDSLSFDSSFNGGNDVIVFPHTALFYSIELVNSQVILRDNDSSYAIPVGPEGLPLIFEDGMRMLKYMQTENEVMIGDQVVTNDPVQITAANEFGPTPGGTDKSAIASVIQAAGSEVTVKGNYDVYGTADGSEIIDYLGGHLDLDPSFNRGGDFLHAPGQLGDYSAYIDGSDLVLLSGYGTISVPLGLDGVTLQIGGASRTVHIDGNSQTVLVGNEIIASDDANAPQQLGTGAIFTGGGGGGGGTVGDGSTLDIGVPGNPAQIILNEGEAYSLPENANNTSFVEIFNFDEDDRIVFSGAQSGDYNFGTSGNDIEITLNNANATNVILIKDAYTGGLVYDEASAEAALGFDAFSFG